MNEKLLEDVEELEALRNEVANFSDSWLRRRGWTYTCKTPGSHWMWTREWDGKHFLVTTDTALRIQAIWDNVHNDCLENAIELTK